MFGFGLFLVVCVRCFVCFTWLVLICLDREVLVGFGLVFVVLFGLVRLVLAGFGWLVFVFFWLVSVGSG